MANGHVHKPQIFERLQKIEGLSDYLIFGAIVVLTVALGIGMAS